MNEFVYNLVYDTLYITAYTKLLFHARIALLCLNCDINMDENFSWDEIEQREIEEVAQVAHADIISVCSCRGMGLRERCRNACPCKGIEQYCSSPCHPVRSTCMNKRSVIQSDFESDSDSLEEAQLRFRDYTFRYKYKYMYFLGKILILEIFT